MKTTALIAFCLAIPLGAQNGGPNENLKSTEVLPDHSVVFRIYAPKASAVSVNGDWIAQGRGKSGPMQKGPDGVWSLTVGPLVPDFYGYSFNVDGVPTLDPKNVQMKTGVASVVNILEVPGPGEEFEAMQAVPHGEIRRSLVSVPHAERDAAAAHLYSPRLQHQPGEVPGSLPDQRRWG